MRKELWRAGSPFQLELPVLPAAERQQLLGDYAERSSGGALSPLAETAWPDAFCWTRMHAESGQALDLIIERKEAERHAGRGVFFWGVGSPLGNKVASLLRRVERPQVLFSVMRSWPKHIDAAPAEVLLWTKFVDDCGVVRALPEHVVVVSRGSREGKSKLTHYALVCQSSQTLQLRPCGGLNLSAFRNLGSSNPRVGNSQVTAILERQPSIEFNKYQVDMVASLVQPYFVRLAGPVPLSIGERASLDVASHTTNGNPQKWSAFARCLRETALARCPGPSFFPRRAV